MRLTSQALVVRRLLRHELRMAAAVLALFVLLGAAESGIMIIRESARSAATASLLAETGHFRYSLQPTNIEGSRALERSGGVHPVAESAGTASTGKRAVPVEVRTVRDADTRLGIVTSGRRPTATGEIALSEHTRTALRVAVGDHLELRLQDGPAVRVEVVGVTANPANPASDTVMTFDSSLDPAASALWLTDREPLSDPVLGGPLDRRSIVLRTNALLAHERADQVVSESLVGAQHAETLYVLLFPTLLLGVGAVMRSRGGRYVTSLMAAGMSWVTAFRVMLAAIGVLSGVGTALGLLLGLVLLRVAMGPLSGLVGQHWLGLSVPVTLVLLVVCIPAVVVAFVAVGAGPARMPALPSLPKSGGRGVGVAAAVCVGAAVGLSALEAIGAIHAPVAVPCAVVWVFALPIALHRGLGHHRGRALSAFQRHVSWAVTCASVLVGLVVLTPTVYAARAMHLIEYSARQGGNVQPVGSLAVLELPQHAAQGVIADFESRGGSAHSLYVMPDETVTRARGTSPGLVDCYRQNPVQDLNTLPERCWPPETQTPVGVVALGETSSGTVEADPGILENGRLGVLSFSASTGVIASTTEVTATPHAGLGGNLPSVVVRPGSSEAKALGLEPSSATLLVLSQFSNLSATDQAEIRSTLSRLAPAAQIAEQAAGEEAKRTGMARAVGWVGFCVALVTMALLGYMALNGQQLARRSLFELSTSVMTRWSVQARWMLIPVVSVIGAGLSGYLAARFEGAAGQAGFGVAWVLPMVGGIIGALTLLPTLVSLPAREE